jgi:hypothetical protein
MRVVVRPKERARRARALAAVAAVAALGAIAFLTVRKLAADIRLPSLTASAGRVDAAVVEGPEPLRSLAQAAADAVSGSAGDKAEAIRARFPSVAEIRVRRPWTEKVATLTLVVRKPVAPALRRGKPAGFLAADGVVFDAPEGAFMLSGPPVDVSGATAAELSALAREYPELSAAGALPAPLTGLAFRSAEEGWEASLADGTKVLWGRLEWTREKLSRLSEAVADARSKEPGAFSADLRWFEDGKVLLKPAALRAGALK